MIHFYKSNDVKRILFYFGAMVLGLLALVYFLTPPITVSFSEAEMQKNLKHHIPYKIEQSATRILVKDAKVTLFDDNTIGVVSNFDATGVTLEGQGVANLRSGVRYKDGKFYLSDIQKEDVKFVWSENSQDTIGEVGQALTNLLQRETQEAEQGEDQERKDTVKKLNAYVEDQLRVDANKYLNSFLSSVPVYDLNEKDMGMKAVALALNRVEISSQGVTAHLSVQTFIARVAAIVFSLLMFALIFGHGILIRLGISWGLKALKDDENVRRIG